MKVTRTSILTGVDNTMTLDITEEQYSGWLRGGDTKVIMPHLEPFQIEFLLSGTTPDEWAREYTSSEVRFSEEELILINNTAVTKLSRKFKTYKSR